MKVTVFLLLAALLAACNLGPDPEVSLIWSQPFADAYWWSVSVNYTITNTGGMTLDEVELLFRADCTDGSIVTMRELATNLSLGHNDDETRSTAIDTHGKKASGVVASVLRSH